MQNIYWMEHTNPEWSILPLLPQLRTAGAVTLKHLNLHVNLLWKDGGSKPQSLRPLGMFILNLNQWIQVGIVHKAPEPWVQMAVASGTGKIWQSWAVCRVCCWGLRNTRLECGRHLSSAAAELMCTPCAAAADAVGTWHALHDGPGSWGWDQPFSSRVKCRACCEQGFSYVLLCLRVGLCVHKCVGTQVLVRHQHTNVRLHITGWF